MEEKRSQEDTKPWYATAFREKYLAAFGPQLTPDQSRAEVDFTLEQLDLGPGARILDLCCGQGRHSIELASRGYEVVGMDLSDYLLDAAERAAEEANVRVRWLKSDMRAIPAQLGRFDAVINMFSSFGVLEDDEEDVKVLQAVYTSLKPGGMLFLDTLNREIVLRNWQPLRWSEQENGALFAEQFRFELLEGRLYAREVLVGADGTRTEEEWQQRLYTYTELASMARRAGFNSETFRVWGDFSGAKYVTTAMRMVFAARK